MRNRIFILLLVITLNAFSSAFAQTTEFVYQGKLINGGSPASSNHDFEFLLFDSLAGGTQIGSTVMVNGVTVTDGTFSVRLNFGAQFPGANRFLEIHVRVPFHQEICQSFVNWASWPAVPA